MLQDYHLPSTVNETLAILSQHGGKAKIIAGGTDLMLELEAKKVQIDYLVDISNVSELRKIELQGNIVVIGAGVTHSEVAKSALILDRAPLLAAACRTVGSLQIRNTGTLGGNVVNAQPAADSAVALVALDARAEIAGQDGLRSLPVQDLYAGVGKSMVDSTTELITRFTFSRLQKNQGSAFVRLAQRKALALPMLNVAVVVSLSGSNTLEWARIAMAPVGPKPIRATEAEKILAGAAINETNISRAAEACQAQADPRSSALRGSREYRKDVLKVLVQRALQRAINEAGQA